MKLKNLQGQTFGRLTVTHRANEKGRRVRWACQCSCGNVAEIVSDQLISGKTQSCGCLKKETIKAVNFSHGMSNTKEYKSWSHAKARCNNKNDPKYPDYGGRGISMCKKWAESFSEFFKDMGPAPKNCTLDRIDVNGNYSPENCRWATPKTQANNTRSNVVCNIDGFCGTLKQFAEQAGVDYKRLHRLVRRKGLSIQEAILKITSNSQVAPLTGPQ